MLRSLKECDGKRGGGLLCPSALLTILSLAVRSDTGTCLLLFTGRFENKWDWLLTLRAPAKLCS